MNKKKQPHDFENERHKRFLQFIGLSYPYKRPASKWEVSEPGKILEIADLHEPYGNRAVFDACEKREKNAEVLFVGGDLGDYYSKSRFRKSRRQSFAQELRSVFFRLEWMATHWCDVRVLLGNHDSRPEKKIMDLFGDEVDLLILTELNLLEYMASFFDNIEIVGTQVNLLGIDEMIQKKITHIYQLGDIIFTHAEKSNVNRITMMTGISRWLREWRSILGLEPYKIIAQAHNHADLRMSVDSEKWFIVPTASTPLSVGMEYIFSEKMIGSPPAVGYTTFYQSKGETDYNRSLPVIMPARMR